MLRRCAAPCPAARRRRRRRSKSHTPQTLKGVLKGVRDNLKTWQIDTVTKQIAASRTRTIVTVTVRPSDVALASSHLCQ